VPTGDCQQGGTWERLLYCLDRSVREYTIQMDADVLAVGPDLKQVAACVAANRSFAVTDGFGRQTLGEAAAMAEATPSNYIGIVAERAFARFPGKQVLHYVRASSGFAGFAKGGFERDRIESFHQTMAGLVGEARWREWGSEQCASNFAVANGLDPVVLPYPEYASFGPRVLPERAKLLHFIGRHRFLDGYYADRIQKVIRLASASNTVSPTYRTTTAKSLESRPLAFARSLVPSSFAPYLGWRLRGRRERTQLQMRPRSEFRSSPGPGPQFEMRPRSASNNDYGVAYEIFVHNILFPPVWIPPERVQLIVDVGANVGMSCLWWLSNYWRARVIAFEPHPDHVSQARANIALNGWQDRVELHQAGAGASAGRAMLSDAGTSSSLVGPIKRGIEVEIVDFFEMIGGQHIDILKMDIEGAEVELLQDERFGQLSIGALVMEWHRPDEQGRGGRDWCVARVEEANFRTYVTHETSSVTGMLWAYREPPQGLWVG